MKNRLLFNKGYEGKKYVLQIWNKKCVKVYEKALYRQPEMWSSNEYLVFKPHLREEGGNLDGDTSGYSSNEEKIYDKYSQDSSGDEKEPAEEEKSDKESEKKESKPRPEPQDLFYIIRGDGDKSEEVIVRNWLPKPKEDESDAGQEGSIV